MTSTMVHSRRRGAVLATALALALTTGTMATADAGDRGSRSGSRPMQTHTQKHRPHGDYTRHNEVRRTDSGHTRSDTWTGERGTTTRRAEVVNDRANQTRTRNVEWTGPQGQQGTRSTIATRDREAGTWTKDVTVDRTPPSGDGG